jgi:tetratricopeptide (TPR) repeat protein
MAVEELLETFEATTSLAEAERALDLIAASEYPEDLPLGEMYDGLAEVAAEIGDFACAVRTQRRALELGCDYPDLGREMLAWYLLKDGKTEEGEARFARLRKERPTDVCLVQTLAAARQDAGSTAEALAALEEALAMAKVWDEEMLAEIRVERRYVREKLGLPLDADDLLARRGVQDRDEQARVAVAWFPRDEHRSALGQWPELAEDLADPDAYCRRIDLELRRAREATGRNPEVAPLRVADLHVFAEHRGLEADSGAARSQCAAEMLVRGETIAWPPGRNDPCWCGSGRKYKRCCGLG